MLERGLTLSQHHVVVGKKTEHLWIARVDFQRFFPEADALSVSFLRLQTVAGKILGFTKVSKNLVIAIIDARGFCISVGGFSILPQVKVCGPKIGVSRSCR